MALDPDTLARDTLRGLGFLSRLPVPPKVFDGDDGRLAHVSRTFPLAGVLITLPAVAVLAAMNALEPGTLLAAALAVAAQIAVTGALHEDGLADTADGFFARGDREDRLAIMKDSRNGTFGTLALVLSQIVRIAALADILAAGTGAAAAALLAASAVSRAAMVWHWHALPSARETGLAAKAGQPERDSVPIAAALAMLCTVLAMIAAGIGVLPAAFAALLGGGAVFAFGTLCRRKIGGQTGDTIGAAQQLCEIAFLAGLAMTL